MRSFMIRLSSLVIAAICCLPAFAQTKEFTDPSGKYKVELMGDWRPVTYNDAVGRSKTEFVYRDRSEGLLKIARESVGGRTIAAFVQDEQETARIYRSGFEMASKEPFGGGGLSGMRLSFFYVEGGRRMAATHYYLQDSDSVWALRFHGRRGALDTIRNITDQIARSFRPQ